MPLAAEGSFIVGGGETGAHVRSMDWRSSLLGPMHGWPQSLRAALGICLSSRFPIALFWGPEFVMLYNDDLMPMVGANKHPQAMGRPGLEVLAEIRGIIEPMLRRVVTTGEAIWSENLMLPLLRGPFQEESYFTFTYSPVRDESGGIGGVFCAVVETTAQVIEERRLRLLNALAEATHAKTPQQACALAAEKLAQAPNDLPFALLYLLDDGARVARLAGVANMEAGSRRAPASIAFGDRSTWAFDELGGGNATAGPAIVEFEDIPGARGGRILPIERSGGGRPFGFIVAGLAPFLHPSDSYDRFHTLLAASLSQAVSSAAASEEVRQRADSLAELDRAKTTFFSNVSHELRTPLTLLLGPASDALAETGLEPVDRERWRLVHTNAQRLEKLVNTLLDFSRIEAGRTQACYRPTDLASLTTDLANTFRPAFERAGLSFEVDCARLPAPVYVDHGMWETIVLNLLSNALKFTYEGSVTVRMRWRGDHAELGVHDTGTGIPGDELGRVFERFHRVEGSRGRTHEGSGIGLALVQELVRLHGGSVRVTSRVGDGSTFTVTLPGGVAHLAAESIDVIEPLPRVDSTQAYLNEALGWLPEASSPRSTSAVPATAPSAGAANGSRARPSFIPGFDRARILVADDNADMRRYVTRILQTHWAVDAVENGEVARERLAAKTYDLVLTDVMMPKSDGFDLLRAVRSDPALAALPVIMLSARAGEEARVEGLRAGADDYLVKPFSSRELLARVSVLLGRAKARADAELAHQELERAGLAKDEFLATASHELRTPLNAILGWARLLRTGKLDQSGHLRAVETIERNAKAQVQLIEDILDGARIITGKLHLEIRPLDMTALISAAMDAVRPAADAKEIEISIHVDPAAARIVGDPERIQQIVWNLANNAIKFTPKGGRVLVRLERVGTSIQLEVADSGQGISSDFLPHVFERFRQAEGSTTRRHGGLGLGLALVRHLVEAHGGTVRAESEGPNRGARFIATLPVQAVYEDVPAGASRVTPTTDESAAVVRLNGVTVLVVDDEADARDLVATVLRAQGAEVTTAVNAERALDALSKSMPMVLLSDIGMPVTDGYALIRRVRSSMGTKGAQIPAIALTAYAREQDRRLALEAGFQTHVSKPVEPSELVRVVAGIVHFVSRGSSAPEIRLDRADTFLKFEKVLESEGLHEGLHFLNSRTPHRFTGVYRFDGAILRNLHLVDSYAPAVTKGDDVPMSETYASIVKAGEASFTTEDTRHDDRLRAHPARDTVISYCGVLLRDEQGQPYGSLCHFDLVPADVPVAELPLMEAAAPCVMKALRRTSC